MSEHGYIYILTNPAFPQFVKIGFATDVSKRLHSLNSSPAVPYSFRVYAIYEVDKNLADLKIHSMIDKLNPSLRTIERMNGKKRVREYYEMSAQDAYSIFEAMAQLHGTEDRLKLIEPSEEEEQEEEDAAVSVVTHNPIHYKFWTVFEEVALADEEFKKEFSLRKTSKRAFSDLAVGITGVQINLFVRTQKKKIGSAIYFHHNKELYHQFHRHRQEIEAELGGEVRWMEAEKDCSIRLFVDGAVRDGEQEIWKGYAATLCKQALLMKRIIKRYIAD